MYKTCLVWTGSLFLPGKSFIRQICGDRVSKFFMNLHRHGIVREFMCVNQAAGELVVGIGGQAVVHEEFGLGVERLRVSLNQAIHFCPGRLRSSDCIGTGQGREILSKTVAGDKSMKVIMFKAKTGEVIPTSHILARSWQTCDLAKDFQESIIVEVQKRAWFSSNCRFMGPSNNSTSEYAKVVSGVLMAMVP